MDDIQKLELKKYERLYDLTLKGLEHEIERYRILDTKINYYLAILAILFGVSTTLAPKIIESTPNIISIITIIFLVLLCVMYVAIISSLVLLVLALKLTKITSYPVSNTTLRYFQDQNYVDILYRISEAMIESIFLNRKRIEKKTTNAHRGFRLLFISLVLIPLNVLYYLIFIFSL